MRLDLAERLRCPAPHGATPLIVVARRTDERELLDGYAGCMTCRLEARVVDGIARFAAPHDITITTDREPSAAESAPAAISMHDADVERTAALLALAEPGGAVLLTGRYAALAAALNARFDVTAAVVVSSGAVPFTDQSFRAAALDFGGDALEDAIRTVMVGGRILAPVSVTLPAGSLKELARDEREWLAAREVPAQVVTLTRSGDPPRTTSR